MLILLLVIIYLASSDKFLKFYFKPCYITLLLTGFPKTAELSSRTIFFQTLTNVKLTTATAQTEERAITCKDLSTVHVRMNTLGNSAIHVFPVAVQVGRNLKKLIYWNNSFFGRST